MTKPKPFEIKTKVWNQNIDDKNTMLHKLYIDYTNAEKTKSCSIKFKTDKLEEIIELHKLKYGSDPISHEDGKELKVMWDDNPAKPSGCKAVLTLNIEKKKIFTLYFFSTGSVLGQGEYCQHYQKLFPQMIKNMTQESGF